MRLWRAGLWPGQNAVGQIVHTADKDWRVAGMYGQVHLQPSALLQCQVPHVANHGQMDDFSSVDLVLRSRLPLAELAPAVRVALKPIEPNLPGNDFRPLQQLVDKAVSPRRFVVVLLAGFASFALILASLGIYGVVSYSVNQRTQEIGIRMALGASATDLQMRVIMQTLALAAAGMLLGVAGSWALARALKGFLFGVTSTDPLTFVAMLIVLTSVAVMAGYLPARRASRIDPMVALRAN